MNISRKHLVLGQTLVALAVAAAFTPARAQQGPDISEVAAPGSSVSVGVGFTSGDEKDRARFGMFNGLRDNDTNLLLDFTYLNRNEPSATWMAIEGRNLGLDNRELSFSYRQLGDMKFTADYGELVRHDPRTINTTLQNAGTANPIVTISPASGAALAAPGTGQDLDLELKRKALAFLFEKRFGNYQLEVSFKNEDKEGGRFFGKGFACSTSWNAATIAACTGSTANAVLMLPEPVDSTIRQLDAKLNYTGEKLRLSGGYYGSFYTNNKSTLTPSFIGTRFGNQNLGVHAADPIFLATMGQPMALWADNQAHQVFLAGNYSLTSHTRLNFKYAYTSATQNESFGGMGLTGAPGGRGDLGGEVNTTKAQVGFSSHPLDKLHLHGDFAYDKKSIKTPVDVYNVFYFSTTPAPLVRSGSFTNNNQSPEKWDAKLEATYRLPQNFLLTGGLKYEHEDYGTFTPTEVAGGISGLRQQMEETSYRVELRKSMSETFTGSASYLSTRKKGDSSWLRPIGLPGSGVLESSENCASTPQVNTGTAVTSLNPCVYSRTAIFPFIYMDRDREMVRLKANWTPIEKLSLQAFFDDGKDTYRGPTEHGLRNTKVQNFSLDASYTLSDDWRMNAYWSRGEQSRDSGHSTGYDAVVTDTATSFGAGITGTPMARLRVGADLVWLDDKLQYAQTADPLASAANAALLASTGGLPDVTYKLTRLKLYGEYAVQKNSYVRLDLIYNTSKFNEWTYNFNGTPFLYSDNTILGAQEKQTVTFIGASYVHKFQ